MTEDEPIMRSVILVERFRDVDGQKRIVEFIEHGLAGDGKVVSLGFVNHDGSLRVRTTFRDRGRFADEPQGHCVETIHPLINQKDITIGDIRWIVRTINRAVGVKGDES